MSAVPLILSHVLPNTNADKPLPLAAKAFGDRCTRNGSSRSARHADVSGS